MRLSILFAALLWGLGSLANTLAGEEPPPSADITQAAFDTFVEAASGSTSRSGGPSEAEARAALVSLGPVVVPKLAEAARAHDDWRVRRSCYRVLTRSFAEDERTADALFQHGLLDEDAGIRYESAFHLGSFKVQRAEQALRAALERAKGKDEEYFRFTVAKSLAELGKPDRLRDLIFAALDDAHMSRYVGNIGLKALSGKSLEDFEGYDYGEGTYVIGGLELQAPLDFLTMVERKSGRFQAAKAYLEWLKAERPELYGVIDPRRKLREAAAARELKFIQARESKSVRAPADQDD